MGSRRPLLRIVAAAAIGVLFVTACSDDDGGDADEGPPATTAAPADLEVDVDGPITGGERGVPGNPMPEGFDDEYGYVEEEWFFSGDAASYDLTAVPQADGRWEAEPAGSAPYTTRAIVRRPADPEDFNGIVAVEWLNVSAGRDSDPDFGFLYPTLLGDGYAYLGISAQATGVEGGGAVLEVPGVPAEALLPLKQWDPERYGPLEHPGDEYSYDIFTQAGELARSGAVLDGLIPEQVIAVGESQSAGRLTTYVNAVQPQAGAYDGFLIHSRGASGSALNPDPSGATPEGAAIREDVDVPVLVFETETDLIRLNYLAARQPDSENIVVWEVAGTAHADTGQLEYGAASGEVWLPGEDLDLSEECGVEINDGPQGEVLRAAFVALVDWVVDGSRPPSGELLEIENETIVRDADGIAVGGIRTPAVDVPISTFRGDTTAESVFCSLFGQTIPFSPERLAELYPSHDDYVDAVTESADAALDAGFLLEADRDAIVAEAEDAAVPD